MDTKISHDSETPAHGQQVITACAFIHQSSDGVDKVFLARRADTKKFLPGVHEMPGGHIEFGENIAEGLKREVKEEFGMDITVGDPFFVYDYINQVKGAHAVEIVYFTRFAGPTDDIHLNPEDHSEYGWFAEADLSKVSRAVDHAHVGGVSPHSDPEFDAIERAFEILRGGRHKVV